MDAKDRERNCFQITWPTTLPECRGICRYADGLHGFRRHLDLDRIDKDANCGCPRCMIIYRSCYEFKKWAHGIDKVGVYCRADHPGIFRVGLFDDHGLTTRSLGDVQLYVVVGSSKPSWDYIKSARTPTIARREEFQQILTPWIIHCNKIHEGCMTKGAKLPSRVLFVGSELEPHLFLHVSSEEDTGEYLALSYCWGQPHPPKTMASNLSKHEKAIDFANLPRTFQDAIVVARAIDIRYLWIDSLCILQDQPSDWQAESSKMAAYYRDAFLVIAAPDASNTAEGFLDIVKGRSPRSSLSIGAEIGHIRNPDGSISHIFKRELDGCFRDRHEHPIRSANLNSRAWALQEYLLAKRIVHFTNGEILWECVEDLKCECMEVDHAPTSEPSSRIMRKSQFIPLCLSLGGNQINFHELWLDFGRITFLIP